MHPELSDKSRRLRTELREYFARIINDEDRRALVDQTEGGPVFDRIYRQMGSDGWLGLGWPEEYGGRGEDPEALYVFYDETIRAGAPVSLVTLNTVAPALMKYGSQEHKDYFLPKILTGELKFAIGYTEPGAGTDLAALQTRARIDGDELVINGTKLFTSSAIFADWIWLAVRTDPDAPRHKGISVVLVPTSSPGFSATEIKTVGGISTAVTYYEDIRVPLSNVVGGVNQGWTLITSQLNHERVALAARGGIANEMYDEVLAWAKQEPVGPGVLFDVPWVRKTLAEVYALLSAADLVNLRLVSDIAANTLGGGDSAAAKIFGTEGVVTAYGMLQEVLGARGLLRPGSHGAVVEGRVESLARRAQNNTFGGGTNEVLREIVAAKTLGMTLGARRRPEAKAPEPAATTAVTPSETRS
ncbi:acyl-CoA dehydrogenase family protein [Rhodococcus sp. (in: high G+C Gram-positive bacteria)]|jgi:alkylation response protein AidB-like acyl-CoA dehydrogenase|uniref:acyl-CoA dehydrogenase family protein n=1 Tax=unclassified Rhodococcus (in: high G+C Gram-positive bacteria) TaxID=192944 RepID=UPI0019F89B43|nr:acyl-CoA dehydrogenase family protein [Rhodococcus sp. (in: high G+C Gram-positive bacteria)]MBF0661522.1 acyl-CoA dehydrogenase family protein [Rhodococcus sp. (in: high G+C Gram-positive bacteria)]